MEETKTLYCTERGYMEVATDVYTSLVERSERLAVYEELMRGYNPVTLIIAGKKQIRKKQRKEDRKAREEAQAEEINRIFQARAGQAYEESRAVLESLKEYVTVPACPDPDKLLALINAGFTTYRLAEEFKTDVETIDLWISRLDAGAEDDPGEAETKPADLTPAEESPAEEAPAEEAPAADPDPAKDMLGSFQAYSGPVTEKKRPGRPRAKIRKDV